MSNNEILLRGGGESKGWNYSHKDKDGYMEVIEGTVVEISTPQHTDFQTKEPAFWKSGNPKRDWQITIKGRSGKELNWRFYAGSNNPDYWNNARIATVEAIEAAGGNSLNFLLGKFIRVGTTEGNYTLRNPRPWSVEILGDGETDAVRGVVPPEKPPVSQAEVMQAGAQAALKAINSEPEPELYENEIPF